MMQLLNPIIDLEDFYDQLDRAPNRILMLDYDGTLAPFQEKRDEAVPYTGIIDILNAIVANGRTRVVIVTGRAIHQLDPLLPVLPKPEVWGNHGWEQRLADGSYVPPAISEYSKTALEKAKQWAITQGYDEASNRIETKPASIAFHWRGLNEDEIAGLDDLVTNAWKPLEQEGKLVLKHFSGGLELGVEGRTKGDAVHTILGQDKESVVAFLGDDRTDELAFEALGTRGLRVLVLPPERVSQHGGEFLIQPDQRTTAADVWIRPPDELIEFLRLWI